MHSFISSSAEQHGNKITTIYYKQLDVSEPQHFVIMSVYITCIQIVLMKRKNFPIELLKIEIMNGE